MDSISGNTRVFLVAGDPVDQVQAPAIFNRLFARHGANAILVPAHVPAAALEDFATAIFRTRNMGGLWLTIPHKTTLMQRLARVNVEGALAGSVNAVRRDGQGGLEGAQFDGLGLVKALHHFDASPAGRRVLLVGGGGAGAAIAAALLRADVAALGLHDRDPARAATLVQRLADARAEVVGADPAGYDLVVHATPLGLRADDPLPFDVGRLSRDAVVVDILMKHRPTPLLRACAERGVRAHPGFEMLVQQVPDYLRFFGFTDLAEAAADELHEVRVALGVPD